MNQYVSKCNKNTPNKKYWVCTFKGGDVYVHTNINNKYLAGGKGNHSHPPNPESVQVKQTREKIKQRVLTELIPIGKIYDEEMTKGVMNSAAVAIFPAVHEMCVSVDMYHHRRYMEIKTSLLV